MAEFKTKYSIGDQVYYAYVDHITTLEPCPACEGAGHIMHNDTMFACTKCGGTGEISHYGVATAVVRRSTVGKIGIEAYENSIKVQYMIKATGIGSGTLWDEDKLFATHEEADSYIKQLMKDKYKS